MKSKYAYTEYSHLHEKECSKCGCWDFHKYYINDVCMFCVLTSYPFKLQITMGLSKSDKFKKAASLFNIITGKKEKDEFTMSFEQVGCLCEHIENLKKLLLIAGDWNNFVVKLNDDVLASGVLWELLNHLKRILEVEGCGQIYVESNSEMLIIPKDRPRFTEDGCARLLNTAFALENKTGLQPE